MFKKTMKFDDLDGNEVTQTFYFNYNKKEVAELLEFGELSQFPSEKPRLPLEQQLKRLTTSVEESGLSEVENSRQAYDIFQNLILDAYGERGEDNVTFVKNEKTRNYFKSHVAFVEMIFEFLENPKLASQFIENCLPAKFVQEAREELQKQNQGKLSSEDLASMVEEAAKRQEDPSTRVEAGESPSVPEEENVIVTDGKTDEELRAMDPSSMSKAQLLRAFEVKSKG